ncbi:MAG TPA: RsmB/NOP family class I SAM-dependent RNA methyltransferase [Opitutaceae bacterium]|nr:RsmB/NOP family class I SAM-dependent RNA methyltransferase [Opitutaceae bacterium]
MSRAGSQRRTLVALLARLRPHWRREAGLPSRIDALLGGDRRLGSSDRRLYRELVYAALRYLPWVETLLESNPSEAVRRIAWLAADTPSVRTFRAEISGDLPQCPPGADAKAAVLGADPEALTPDWFRAECPEASLAPLRDVLLSRAPLWLRLQTGDPGPALAEFDRLGWAWRRSPRLAGAVALPPDSDVARTDAYLSGGVEIQDVGSQLVLESAGVAPGGLWLDACAGSGGKTLQLACLLGPGGRVIARDLRRGPLDVLGARAARAGLADRIAIGSPPGPRAGFDGVLVDAPCSGSGTWRRSPHLRWVTTPRGVRAAAARQLELMRENAARVRQGGLLVYATCSLCRSENESVVEAFLRECPGFEPELAGLRLLPQAHDGDGFFVASLRRSQRAA